MLNIFYSAGATNAVLAGSPGVQSGGIWLWGVQLEVGSVATPLEKPDPRYDLANCQRFYQTGTFSISAYATAGMGAWAPLLFPVLMRGGPTVACAFTTQTNCGSSGQVAVGVAGFSPYTVVTAAANYVLTGSFTATADL